MPFQRPKNAEDSQEKRRIFVGRTEELEFFARHILEAETPTHNIVAISGNTGVGKSTLLAQFSELASMGIYRDYCFIARVGEQQVTPIAMMEKFSQQLHLAGEPLTAFEAAMHGYKENLRGSFIRHEIMSKKSPKMPERFLFDEAVFEDRKGEVIKHEFYTLDESREQWPRENKQLNDLTGEITQIFVSELNRVANTTVMLRQQQRQRRFLLFFDPFEQLASEAVPWLLHHFLEAEVSSNIVLVMAGHSSLERAVPQYTRSWLSYRDDGIIYSIALSSFSKEETRKYIEAHDIVDKERLETVWKLSQGLPLYLSHLVANPQQNLDPTRDVVDAILGGISDNEEIKRRLALDVALFSKPFNQDDLEALQYITEENRTSLYQWLSEQSFVTSNPLDGRLNYHELTREMFSRYLYQSPKQYQATRRSLAEYYQHLLKRAPIKVNRDAYCSAEWLELALALITQLLYLPEKEEHIRALEQALLAYDCTDREQDKELLKILDGFAQDKPNSQMNADARQVALQLSEYITANITKSSKKILSASDYLLEYTANDTCFSNKLRAFIHKNRGSLYYSRLDKNEEALKECNLALECDTAYFPAYVLRGEIYNYLDRYTEALADFEQAQKINKDVSENAHILFHLGMTSRFLGKYEEALKYLEEALDLKEYNAQIFGEMGETLYSLKRYQEASDAFIKAITEKPETTFYWTSLAKTYRALHLSNEIPTLLQKISTKETAGILACQGEALRVSKYYEQALAVFTRAIELTSEKSNLFSRRAKVYEKLNRLEDALADLTSAIVLKPNDATLLTRRGEMYGYLGRHDEALHDFQRALQLKRKSGRTFLERGIVHSRMGNKQAALLDFDRAIELDTNVEHTAYEEKGVILHELGKYKEAIESYTKAFNKNMECARCWRLLASSYTKISSHEQIPALLRAVPLPSDIGGNETASIISCRAEALRTTEHFGEALVDLECALELDETNAFTLLTRGRIHINIGRYEDALDSFMEVIRLDSDYKHEGFQGSGLVLVAQKKYQEACESFIQALVVNPTCKNCWGSLLRVYEAIYKRADVPAQVRQVPLQEDIVLLVRGKALQTAGYWEEAMNDFTQAISRAPENVEALQARGENLLNLRRFEDALEDFQHVLQLKPRNAEALLGRGRACSELARYNEALHDLDQVSLILPDWKHNACENKGKIFIQQEKYVKAKEALIKALNYMPDCEDCWALLIVVYEYIYPHEKISKSLKKINVPEIDGVILSRAQALRERGYYQEALQEIEQLRGIDSFERGNGHSVKGLILSSLGKYAQAIESYQRELQQTPETFRTFYNIAIAMIYWQGFEAAQESIEEARTALLKELYGKKRGAALYGLGGIEAALCHKEKSLDYLHLAVLLEEEAISWAKHDRGWSTLQEDEVFQKLTAANGRTYSYFYLHSQNKLYDGLQFLEQKPTKEIPIISSAPNQTRVNQKHTLIQATRPSENLAQQDIARLVDILARLAANSFEGSRLFFRGLLGRVELPSLWVQEIADVWTGNANHDADKLIRWGISKRVNPQDPQYMTLGSILKTLLPNVGIDDARTIAAVMEVYQLCMDREQRENMALRYQLPMRIKVSDGPVGSSSFMLLKPLPEENLNLQSWLKPEPDLLDVGLIMQASTQAAGVCRIELSRLGRMGTGFLIAPRLVLTNYHVLKRYDDEDLEENARETILRFGCTSMSEGQIFKLAEDQPVICWSPTSERDYVLLQADEAITRANEVRVLQYSLQELHEQMELHILQHSGGGIMKLALHSNGVRQIYAERGLVHYVTQAKEGSSGSPCFNELWEIVAIHRAERSVSFGSVREGILFKAIYNDIKGYL